MSKPPSQRLPFRHGGLRVIAVIKLVKAALLIAVGFGSLRYINRDLAESARQIAHHLNIDPENHVVRWVIAKAGDVQPEGVRHFSELALLFALDQVVEGIGLWFYQAWAKYLLLVATALGLVLDGGHFVVELAHGHFSWWRFGSVVFFLAIFAYLVAIFIQDRRRVDDRGGAARG